MFSSRLLEIFVQLLFMQGVFNEHITESSCVLKSIKLMQISCLSFDYYVFSHIKDAITKQETCSEASD